MKIASYFASVGFTLDVASMKRVDKTLAQYEKKLKGFSQRINKDLKLKIELPAITVKKFKIDELALQRNSQMALNRVGRLLELPIQNFKVDQVRLNRQMQGVMQRASNAARVNVKTIQGSAGGSNAFFPKLPTVYQYQHGAPRIPYASSSFKDAMAGSFSGASAAFMPGRLAMFSGPAMALAAPVAAGYYAHSSSLALGNEQAQREAQRVQLDVASGATTRKGKDAQNKAFFDLANRTGTNAAELIPSYSQMMKTLQAIGLSSNKAFGLYKDMSLFAKSTGASGEQQSRAAYAIGQIYGKGYVSREELNLQLADALPSFKKYLKDVYEAESGKKGGAAFDKALTDKAITTKMMEDAFRRAAEAGMGNVAQYAGTVQASQARFANIKFEEQLSRTMSDDVLPSMKRYVEAQEELYKSMQPLRNASYEAAAGVLSFSASLLKGSAPYIEKMGTTLEGSPRLKSALSNPITYLPDLNPALSLVKYGYVASQAFREKENVFSSPSPLVPVKPEWQNKADNVYSIDRLMNGMQSKQTNNNINVGEVNLNLNSTATNGQDLLNEIRPAIRQTLIDEITSTLIQYPMNE